MHSNCGDVIAERTDCAAAMCRQPAGSSLEQTRYDCIDLGDKVGKVRSLQNSAVDDDASVDHGEIDIAAGDGVDDVVVEVAIGAGNQGRHARCVGADGDEVGLLTGFE